MKKIDFHIHTIPTISDSVFNFELDKIKEYVDRLNIDAIAITNHNLFDQNQFNLIKESLSITVFPGIEINLDGGHLLLIAENDEFEVSNFEEKCKLVNAKIITNTDSLSLEEFKTIFPEINIFLFRIMTKTQKLSNQL